MLRYLLKNQNWNNYWWVLDNTNSTWLCILVVLALHTYLQVSFGNASFLDAELKVLHLPVEQKSGFLKNFVAFCFHLIKKNIKLSACLTDVCLYLKIKLTWDADLLSSSSWFTKSTLSLSAASTKVRNWSILASIFNTRNSVYLMT